MGSGDPFHLFMVFILKRLPVWGPYSEGKELEAWPLTSLSPPAHSLSLKSERQGSSGSLADMRPVGGVLLLVLLLGLLVEGVGSELRPRDPELEEHLVEQLEGLADSPLVEEKGNYPARSG